MKVWQVLLIILIILVAALIGLYIWGRRLQKKQAEQQEAIEAAKQTVSMLIIDKKRLPVKDSGLPQMVIDQVPKLMRRSKMPIVKVKVGPRVMNMIAEDRIFDMIPVKKEVKAVISGIYITDVKGLHGPLQAPEVKKGFWQRMKDKLRNASDKANETLKQEEASTKKKKK